jgi:hypothetical protein
MRCPRCEAETPDRAKFCIECGTPLTPRWPQCGADTLPRAKFCGACGTPLTAQSPAPPAAPPPIPRRYTPGYLAEKILTAKAALEGECKQVTVLFADLEYFPELLVDRDPEETRQLLDPVLQHLRRQSTVMKVPQNRCWATRSWLLFAVVTAHEDYAVPACHVVLAMQVLRVEAAVQPSKLVPTDAVKETGYALRKTGDSSGLPSSRVGPLVGCL